MHHPLHTRVTGSARWLLALPLTLLACATALGVGDPKADIQPPPTTGPAPVLGKGSWCMTSNLTKGDWSKTGLYYEKPWVDQVDCYAGGNTTLELYIKALSPHTIEQLNAGKIGITLMGIPDATHPAGSAAINFAQFVKVTNQEWTKVSIPMSAFKDFNFTKVIAFAGVPVAFGAGDFSMGVDEIRFVGGPTPVLWYGDAHPNNPFAPHGIMKREDGKTVSAVEIHYEPTGGVEVDEKPAAAGGTK